MRNNKVTIGQLKNMIEGKILQSVEIAEDSDEGLILSFHDYTIEVVWSSCEGGIHINDDPADIVPDIK